jgi:hypothetical protein
VRFVEVVEVEHEIALGGGVEPEVAEVRVAAHDRRDPRGRQPGEIGGVRGGRSPEKGVGRGDHPPDAHGGQPVQPTLVRTDHLIDDVRTVGWGSPVPERGAWRGPAQPTAERVPRRARGAAVPQRREPAVVGRRENRVRPRPSLIDGHL